MHFDLVDLRLFLDVADAGSLTHGAVRSNLSLAAASERVRNMEIGLGVALLRRRQRGVELTAAGNTLCHHARLILSQVSWLQQELAAHAAGVSGRVRLLSNTAALTEYLPDVLARFLAAHPRMDVDVEEKSSREIVRAVTAGDADLGIVSDAIELGRLVRFPLCRDRLVLVLPAGHALAHRDGISFAQLLDGDFIGVAPGSALQDHLAHHAAEFGRTLKLRVRVKGFDAVCRMVGQGVGIAIVPESACRRHDPARLAVVPLADPWADRMLCLCLRDPGQLPPVARRLFDHLTGGEE